MLDTFLSHTHALTYTVEDAQGLAGSESSVAGSGLSSYVVLIDGHEGFQVLQPLRTGQHTLHGLRRRHGASSVCLRVVCHLPVIVFTVTL